MDDLASEISDKIFLKDLRNEFFLNVISGIEKLEKYIKEENYGEMRKIAHDMKGVSSVFGYDKGSHLSENLMNAIDEKNKKLIKSITDEVIEYYKRDVIADKNDQEDE
ncbi:MAG: Hpt domain-containing protein [Acidobacteriota bacterium]